MNDLKISGVVYSIKEIDGLARDREALGEHCGNTAVINLDNGLTSQIQQKTLLHEIIEAINYQYELHLEHNKISVLETAIFAILKDNIWLFDFLKG